MLLQHSLEDGFRRGILSKVRDGKAIAFQHQAHNIFPDIVDISLDGGNDHRRMVLRGILRSGLQADFVKGRRGRFRAHEQLGQEQRVLFERFPCLVQHRHNLAVDDIQAFLLFQQLLRQPRAFRPEPVQYGMAERRHG